MTAFAIPIRTVSEANARDHWAKRAKRMKTHRRTAYLATLAALRRRRIALPCVVTITRVAPSNGLDSDNLAGSAKGARDGIADALHVDDGSPLVEWRYAQRRGPWGVEVEIRTLEGDANDRSERGTR